MEKVPKIKSRSTSLDFLYNGKENIEELDFNMLEYGFRLYDPAIGRFPSVDPVADNFAFVNGFNYAENKPIRGIDLWGLQYWDKVQTPFIEGDSKRFIKNNPEAALAIPIILMTGGLAFEAAPGIITYVMVNPQAATAAGGILWGLGTDADMPGGGDDIGRGFRALFRGTTKGFVSRTSKALEITPTSTDPLVSTLFAIESKRHGGEAVVNIALDSDLKGAKIIAGNVLSKAEKEVGVEMIPTDFEKISGISIGVEDARKILKDMGFDTPARIGNIESLNTAIKESPRLNDEQIQTFIEKAKEVNTKSNN